MDSVFQTLIFLLPMIITGIVHSVVIKKQMLLFLAKPIDFGLEISGKRILGDNKTFRAPLLFMVINGLLTALLGLMLQSNAAFAQLSLVDIHVNWFLLGVIIGLTDRLAELPNSFVKRRRSIKPGQSNGYISLQYIIDQADGPLAISAVLTMLGYITIVEALLLFFAGFVLHALIDYLFFVRTNIKSTKHV